MALILDGKKLSLSFQQKITSIISQNNFKKLPTLAIVQVGDLFESNIYIKHKLLMAQNLGFNAILHKYDEQISQQELINNIKQAQRNCDGIIVQLPLPKHLETAKVLEAIDIDKDIDGLTAKNMQFLEEQKPGFLPATALGIILLLKSYSIDILNSKIGILGESKIVGYPVKLALLKNNENVFSYNKDSIIPPLKDFDVLIVATGVKHLVKKEDVSPKSIIIDVGIHRDENNKVTGDCDFNSIKDIVKAITPVPGGVGPMTVISLVINLIVAYGQKDEFFSKKFSEIIDLASF